VHSCKPSITTAQHVNMSFFHLAAVNENELNIDTTLLWLAELFSPYHCSFLCNVYSSFLHTVLSVDVFTDVLAVVLSDVMFFLSESNHKYTFFAQDNKVGTVSTLCLDRNAQTLASCRFYKHGLILTIFGKQRQHTFKNDFLSLHFYLLFAFK